jgi:transcription elongation factor Elf1
MTEYKVGNIEHNMRKRTEVIEKIRNGEKIRLETDHPEITATGIDFRNCEQYYKSGTGTIECKNCGEEIAIECEEEEIWDDENLFNDVAYCKNCDIRYSRNRALLLNDIPIDEVTRNIDDTYNCDKCEGVHRYSAPTYMESKLMSEAGYEEKDYDWQYTKNPSVHSYEYMTVNCPCGESFGIGSDDVSIEEFSVDCSNCGRVYDFNVNTS